MPLILLVSILGVHLLALMSPGPDFFVVMQTAVSRTRKEALLCSLGVAIGMAFWAGLSLLGMHLLFEKYIWLQKVLIVLGGSYLIWMGFQLLKTSGSGVSDHELRDQSSLNHSSGQKAFVRGLLTNLSNAKAIIYFSSVFSMMISTDMNPNVLLLLFLLIVFESFFWFAFVSFVLSAQ